MFFSSYMDHTGRVILPEVQTPQLATSTSELITGDTEEGPNTETANAGMNVSDEFVAMGIINAELASYLRSVKITVMALFSILTVGQIKMLK